MPGENKFTDKKDNNGPLTRCIENEHSLDDINPVPASLPVLLIKATLSPSISFLALRQLLLLHLMILKHLNRIVVVSNSVT